MDVNRIRVSLWKQGEGGYEDFATLDTRSGINSVVAYEVGITEPIAAVTLPPGIIIESVGLEGNSLTVVGGEYAPCDVSLVAMGKSSSVSVIEKALVVREVDDRWLVVLVNSPEDKKDGIVLSNCGDEQAAVSTREEILRVLGVHLSGKLRLVK
jgi:hypothetical protein